LQIGYEQSSLQVTSFALLQCAFLPSPGVTFTSVFSLFGFVTVLTQNLSVFYLPCLYGGSGVRLLLRNNGTKVR
jgi:hypothetical protein